MLKEVKSGLPFFPYFWSFAKFQILKLFSLKEEDNIQLRSILYI